MRKRIIAAMTACMILLCQSSAFADSEAMRTITFDSWTSAYAESNFRVIYGGSSNPSIFADAFANKKVFGGKTRSFFYGNRQGSDICYTGGYGKINNFSDSALGEGYAYKCLSFDFALQSVNTQMYIISSTSSGTRLFEVSGGKILAQKKTVLENPEAKRWYNVKIVEKSDGTWKTYIDNKCMLTQQGAVISVFNELRFVYEENNDTYKSESGLTLYNAGGFYLDNIELSTLGSEPVITESVPKLTSTAATVENEFPRCVTASRSVTAAQLLASLNTDNAEVLDSDSEQVPASGSAVGRYLRIEDGGREFIYPIKSTGQSHQEFETTVFANESFESSAESITHVQKDGTIDLVREGGEGYLRVKKAASSDMYFEVNNIAVIDKRLICEFTVINKSSGMDGNIFMLRDNTSGTAMTEFYLRISGSKLYAGEHELCSFGTGEERNIILSFDLSEHKWDAYAGGSAVLTNMDMSDSLECITTVRFYFGSGAGELYFDNLRIYNAENICSIENIVPVAASPFKNSVYGRMPLMGNIAVETSVSSLWDGSEKYYAEYPFVQYDGEYYMESGEAEELFGVSAENTVSVGTAEYVSVKAAARDAGLSCTDNGKGLLIFSDGVLGYTGEAIDEAYKYMLFRRYGKQTITGLAKKSHPYILGASDEKFTLINSLIGQNLFLTERYNKIKDSADNLISTPVLKYQKTGIRLYSVAVEYKKRVTELAVMYRLTGDNKYKERLEKEITAVCLFSDWNAESHYLDASEIAFATALCIDWLNSDMTGSVLSLAKEKICDYYLDYSQLAYDGKFSAFWVTSDINWNAVCNGATAIAAMAVFEDEPEKYSGIIANALRGYENCIVGFAPSGSWHEGPHYWEYTTEYLAYLHSSLEGFFGNDLDFGKVSGIDRTAYYQMAMDSPQGMNGYHDGFSSHVNSAALLYFGKRYSDKKITSAKLYADELYGTFPEVGELLWLDTDVSTTDYDIIPDMYFEGSEAVSLRESHQKTDSAYLSFHGGDNSDEHAHADGGAFVLDMLGERWFLDMPIENYDASGESAEYRKSLRGHNTVEIIPNGKEYGTQSMTKTASVTNFESGSNSSFAVMDMTPLYDEAKSFKRGIMLSNEKRTAHIRDEITLSSSCDIIWRAATDADVKIEGSKAVLTKNGKSVTMYVNASDGAILSVNSSLPLSSYANPGKKIKQIEITLKKTSDAYIDVCLSEGCSQFTQPFSRWQVNESDAKFTDKDGNTVYKMPDSAVTVRNNSQAAKIVACYDKGKLISASKIACGEHVSVEKCEFIKVFTWDDEMRPITDYKILK